MFPLALSAIATVVAFSLAWHSTQPGSHVVAVSDWLTVAAATGAAIAALLAWRTAEGRPRTGWALIAAGAALSAVGEVCWLWYELVLNRSAPYPSPADIGYLAGSPFAAAGLLFLGPVWAKGDRARDLLYAASLTLLPAAIVWHFGLLPTFAASDASAPEKTLSASYPVADLVVLVCAVAATMRLRGQAAVVLGTLAASQAIMLLTDVLYARSTTAGAYASGGVLDSGWIAAYALMALAAVIHLRSRPRYAAAPAWGAASSLAGQALPGLMLFAVTVYAIGAGLGNWGGEAGDDPAGIALCLLAALAITARQLGVLLENRRLAAELHLAHADLELRVKERTRELSRLASIVQATSDLIATATLDGRPLFLNRAGRVMLGLGPSERLTGDSNSWIAGFPGLLLALEEHGSWSGEGTIPGATGPIPVSAVVAMHDDGESHVVSVILRDISERRTVEAELAQRTRELSRLEAIIQTTPDWVGMWGRDGRALFLNQAGRSLMGIDQDGPLPANVEHLGSRFPGLVESIQKHGFWSGEGSLPGPNGDVPVSAVIALHQDGDDQVFSGIMRDITERKAAEAEIARRTRELSRFEAIIQATPDLIGARTTDGKALILNRAGREMLGFGPDEALDRDGGMWAARFPEAMASLRARGHWSGEGSIPSVSGDIPVSAVFVLHDDGEEQVISAIVRDISDQKAAEAELIRLASHDELTGLLNRREFSRRAEELMSNCDQGAALLFVDIDGFKYVNDSFGHQAGDDLLVEIAQNLATVGPDGSLTARLGGDEFALFLPEVAGARALQIAVSICETVRALRFGGEDRGLRVTASVGVALSPEHGATLRDLLSNADLAMYRAKERRDDACLYSIDLRSTPFDSQVVWENVLRDAIAEDRLRLYAQPIVHLVTGERHYELLLRLRTAAGEIIPPAEFLPVAERSGLIHQLDRWVVKEAVRVAARLERAGRATLLEVNLSGRSFADDGLVEWTRDAIVAAGIDATRLVFEITETAAIAELPRARAFVERLRELGCRFALDDFGAGFSSFTYLKHLPVDFLKVDGSFITGVARDEQDQLFVGAMVNVARGLGKQTIAEFVGDRETVDTLRLLDVDYAQGYFIGRPMPVEELFQSSEIAHPAA